MKKFNQKIVATSIILVLSLVMVASAATPSVPGDEGSGDPDGEARDPASFTITVTNNGDVNLTPIAVLDYINGVKVPECSQNLTGLRAQ